MFFLPKRIFDRLVDKYDGNKYVKSFLYWNHKHTSEVWKVAVNEERRKEFNSEWCLCPDMVRSGYIADHIDYNYPKDTGGSDFANYPWSKRSFDFNIEKMDMPIPATEIMKNSALKQNPAYAGEE